MIPTTIAVELGLLGKHLDSLSLPKHLLTDDRFESRDICEEIIRKFHGQPIGEDGLLLQVRYADTPAQKDLKRITTERRQFRTNEYNVGAYGTASDMTLSPPIPSPLLPRANMISHHISNSRSEGTWKRDESAAPAT